MARAFDGIQGMMAPHVLSLYDVLPICTPDTTVGYGFWGQNGRPENNLYYQKSFDC